MSICKPTPEISSKGIKRTIKPPLRSLFKPWDYELKLPKPPAAGGDIYQSLMLEAKTEFEDWEKRMELSPQSQRSSRSRKNGRATQSKARKAKNSSGSCEEDYCGEEQEDQ